MHRDRQTNYNQVYKQKIKHITKLDKNKDYDIANGELYREKTS